MGLSACVPVVMIGFDFLDHFLFLRTVRWFLTVIRTLVLECHCVSCL